jgi:hypothetical protein
MTASPVLPLLHTQRTQWESHHEDPLNPRYNCGGYFELTGALNVELLTQAVDVAFSETEALRAVYVMHAGVPWQTVAPPEPAPMTALDLSSGERARTEAAEWMEARLGVPFDLLSGDSACSHTLLRVAADEYFFFFRYHHIALDAYGAHRYLFRIAQVYNALSSQEPVMSSGFDGLARLVADQEAYTDSRRAGRDNEYWRKALSGAVAHPGISGRRAPARPQPTRSTVRVPDSSWTRLVALAARLGVHWPSAVISLTACYLSRVTASSEVVIGFLAANRTTSASVRTPANLANELPLRFALAPSDTFADLIRSAARSVTDALSHQQVHWSDAAGSDLLHTFVNIISFVKQPRFTGCESEFHVLATGPATNFRINCYGDPATDGSLLLEFEVNPALYDEDQLGIHRDGLLRLLDELLASPGRPLATIAALVS